MKPLKWNSIKIASVWSTPTVAAQFTEIKQHPIAEKVGVLDSLAILIDQLKGSTDGHFADLLLTLSLLTLQLLALQLPHQN